MTYLTYINVLLIDFIVNHFPFYKGFQIYVAMNYFNQDNYGKKAISYDSLTNKIRNCFIKYRASTKSILYLELSQRSSLWS